MENNYQLSRIHNYVSGLMSKDEMHTLEREALDDPLLQDAIEGYKLQNGVSVKQLSLLQQRLATRIDEHAVSKIKRFYSWQRLAVGATAAVMFVTVSVLLLIRYLPPATSKSNLAEVEIMQDLVYSISVESLPGFDGHPQSGWNAFDTYLSRNYTTTEPTDVVMQISFKIDDHGRPYAFRHIGATAETAKYFVRLKELIDKGGAWNGHEASLHVDIHRMNM